jgi:tetratricopeptide (TPR) repeat protein
MSLLMQALKKAERARQNGLPEEHASPDDWGLEPRADGPAPDLPDAALSPPASEPAPRPSPGLAELSLEPLEPPEPAGNAALPAAGPRREPVPEPGQDLKLEPSLEPAVPPSVPPAAPARARPHIEPLIPLEPATEAVHDPVPPQARHEPARNRAPAGAARAGATAPDSRPKAAAAGAATARAGAAARARAAAAAEKPGVDMVRMRVAGLSGIALVILATFGYVYWRATTAPGPGAALPMVPMPPPSATGATGIAVPPAGPPFGPATPLASATAPAGSDMTGAGTPAGAETTGASAPFVAPSSVPAVAGAPVQAVTAPPAAVPPPQRYLTDDPALQRAAQQDEGERMLREERARAAASGFAPQDAAGGGAATRSAPAYAPPSAGPATTAVQIARGSSTAIAPAVSTAYAAFVGGDYATARQEYDNALRQDPNNRDALLGSAAVAQREGRGMQAAAAYARLLELDPTDPDALAALVALRPGDLARSETQLRNVLKSRPDAAPVLFALGNLYARQNRWPEAQQAYFRAYTAAPGNADYAFNLAVGLDRLNQGKLAVTYYQQALAATGPAGFDRAAVQRRVRELREAAAPASAPSASAAPAPAWPERGN